MTTARPQRPPLLVTVCIYIGAVCAIQGLTAASIVGEWTSMDGQASRKPLIDALVRSGLARGTAETSYRTFLILVAGLAAMCVVLAVYTAKSHRASRIVLTVLAVAVASFGATGPFLSEIMAIFLLVCVAQLWSGDIRRHFRGEPPAVRTPRPVPVPSPGSSPAAQVPLPSGQSWAPQHPARPTDWVKIWSIVTLVAASMVALGCTIFLVVYGVARDELVQMQVDSRGNWANLTEAEVREGTRGLAVLSWAALPLCLVAIGVSIVLLVRRRGRR